LGDIWIVGRIYQHLCSEITPDFAQQDADDLLHCPGAKLLTAEADLIV
jgi:hypothetical protein